MQSLNKSLAEINEKPITPSSSSSLKVHFSVENDVNTFNNDDIEDNEDEKVQQETPAARETELIRPKRSRIPDSLRKSSHVPNLANIDHVLNLVGAFGLYQMIQLLLVGFLALVPSMVAYSYVFVSATPKFTCSIVKEIELISSSYNENRLLGKKYLEENSDIPFENFELEKSEFLVETKRFIRLLSLEELKHKRFQFDSSCKLNRTRLAARLNRTAHSIKCVEWIYDDSVYGSTTVTDWNLICLESHFKALTQNAFILGTGCSLFTGILSDKYGRKQGKTE
jgi:hypothetical protein